MSRIRERCAHPLPRRRNAHQGPASSPAFAAEAPGSALPEDSAARDHGQPCGPGSRLSLREPRGFAIGRYVHSVLSTDRQIEEGKQPVLGISCRLFAKAILDLMTLDVDFAKAVKRCAIPAMRRSGIQVPFNRRSRLLQAFDLF